MKCINCNKETKNLKYCSRSCSAKINSKLYPKRKTTKLCKKCNSIVKSYRHNLCEIHQIEYLQTRFDYIKKLTLEDYWSKKSLENLHSSSKNAHIRGLARSNFKHLLYKPCANCGYNKHVELCHIIPISSFNKNSTIGEVNSLNNLIQLCPNCHWEFDNKLLSLSTILDSNQ